MTSGLAALIVAALTATYSYGALNGTIKTLLDDIKKLQDENKELWKEISDLRVELYRK